MFRCIVGLCLIFTLLLTPVAAQDATSTPIDRDTQFQMLEETTVSIRGLDTLETVTRGFPTRAEVREYIEESIALSFSDESVAEMTAFYTAFDFILPGTDLRAVINELYAQQVAGYYDPETKQMNVVAFVESGDEEKPLGLLDKIIYVHEYTHALQDQHFDLNAYLESIETSDNSDQSLAQLSLVEGDATFVMNEFAVVETQKNPLGALMELAAAGTQAGGFSLPASTPKVIGDELLFPYLDGEKFVRALLANGGIEAVNRAYHQPPTSTEQILHPELYLAGEDPLPLTLESTPPDDTWIVADTGIMGEFYLRSYLATQLTAAEAAAGAAGWGNGVYAIYQHADEGMAWTLSLVWDNEDEQAEFEDLFHTFAQKRIAETMTDDCYLTSTGNTNSSEVSEVLCMRGEGDHTMITFAANKEIARQLLETVYTR
jgi:hypothetical protein